MYHSGEDVIINCNNIMSVMLIEPLDNIDTLVGIVYVGVSDGYAGDKHSLHTYGIHSADSYVSTNSPILASLLGEYVKVQTIKQY